MNVRVVASLSSNSWIIGGERQETRMDGVSDSPIQKEFAIVRVEYQAVQFIFPTSYDQSSISGFPDHILAAGHTEVLISNQSSISTHTCIRAAKNAKLHSFNSLFHMAIERNIWIAQDIVHSVHMDMHVGSSNKNLIGSELQGQSVACVRCMHSITCLLGVEFS